jgi:tetratricopeptide (TPR) repeat protein
MTPALLVAIAMGTATPPRAGGFEGEMPWVAAPLLADPDAVRAAAEQLVGPEPEPIVWLYHGLRVALDPQGRAQTTEHWVARVHDPADPRAQEVAHPTIRWLAWREARPAVNARVLGPGGASTKASLSETKPGESSALLELGPLEKGSIVEVVVHRRDEAAGFEAGVVRRLAVLRGARRARLDALGPAPGPKTALVGHPAPARALAEPGLAGVRYELANLDPPLPQEPSAPPDGVELRVSNGRTWQEVAKAYAGRVDAVLAGAELGGLFASGGIGNQPRDRQVEALARLLAARVAVAPGRLDELPPLPEAPAEALKRRKANSREAALLLAGLLGRAGIPAHLALIRGRPGYDVDPALPGLGDFDQALVYLPGAARPWLDPLGLSGPPWSPAAEVEGRWALVVAPLTTELVKIPVSQASANRLTDRWQILLRETGRPEASRQIQAVGAFERTRGRREATERGSESRLGKTERREATVTLPIWATLREGLPPAYLRGIGEPGAPPRRRPLVLPFAHEVEVTFTVRAPPGFVLRSIPVNREASFGAVSYRLSAESTGRDVALTARLVVAETLLAPEREAELREGLAELARKGEVTLRFDFAPALDLDKGDLARALRGYREVARAHPGSAVYQGYLAEALLAAGLGESARRVAEALALKHPESPHTWGTVGFLLGHDLLGRPIGTGFDRPKALSAFERARQIQEADPWVLRGLAMLLEHDARGRLYGAGSDPERAARLWLQLADQGKTPEALERGLRGLAWTHQWSQITDRVTGLQPSELRDTWVLASLAADQGVTAATTAARELVPDPAARAVRLVGAMVELWGAHELDRAAELAKQLAGGGSGDPFVRWILALHEARDTRSEPVAATRRFLSLCSDPLEEAAARELLAPAFRGTPGARDSLLPAELASLVGQWRASRNFAVAPEVMMESFELSCACVEDGSPAEGWQLEVGFRLQGPPLRLVLHAIAGEGGIRLLPPGRLDPIGELALQALAQKKLELAAIWVERGLGLQRTGPRGALVGPLLSRIAAGARPRGERDLALAAAAMVASGSGSAHALALLGRAKAELPGTREAGLTGPVTLALLAVHQALGRMEDVAALGATLRATAGLDPEALALPHELGALAALGRHAERAALAKQARQHPTFGARAEALLAVEAHAQGNARGAAHHWNRALAQASELPADAFRELAWLGLMLPGGPVDSLRIARTSVQFRWDARGLRVLAALLAETGELREAVDRLREARDIDELADAPLEELFVLARVAEQAGLLGTARGYYERLGAGPLPAWLDGRMLAQAGLQRLATAERGAPSADGL